MLSFVVFYRDEKMKRWKQHRVNRRRDVCTMMTDNGVKGPLTGKDIENGCLCDGYSKECQGAIVVLCVKGCRGMWDTDMTRKRLQSVDMHRKE